jgi:hypothetical protein
LTATQEYPDTALMSSIKKTRAASLGVLVAALLAGCGGGDDGQQTLPTGAWVGTTSTQRGLTALVLGDGSYYMLYSDVAGATQVAGAVQGTATLDDLGLHSSDALEFNVEGAGISPGSLSATFSPSVSFGGEFTSSRNTSFSFQTRYDNESAGTPSLPALAGSYTGQAGFALGVRPATFAVTATGQVTSSINDCSISGSASPRPDVNVYDLTIVFGGPPCALPNATFKGVAYLRESTGRLVAVARNEATRQSVLFSGLR